MRTTAIGHPVINAAYEIDRLIAFHASIPELHHRLPFLRATRNRQLSMCELERGGAPEWRELERLTERLPLLLLIGDDDHQSTGPAGWPGLQRMRYWRPRKVIVHATGGDEAISQDIVTSMTLLRRLLLVETSSAHASVWTAWGEALKPHNGVLTILHPGGQHPKPHAAH